MRPGLIITAMLVTACGRTEPVDGLAMTLPTRMEPPGTDAGAPLIQGGPCQGTSALCPRGFHCETGVCVLNGDRGELQVTLQWKNVPRTPDDLDLHLVEPSAGGGCEIYYGSSIFTCQPMGQLDLDANGACEDTGGGLGADTENIIYPADRAVPRGHYLVRVDYWAECSGSTEVPFEVIVRKGSEVIKRSGTFFEGQSDRGDLGSGVTVLEFDVP